MGDRVYAQVSLNCSAIAWRNVPWLSVPSARTAQELGSGEPSYEMRNFKTRVSGELISSCRFTGIDAPYETPEHPELVLDAASKSPDALADEVEGEDGRFE